MSGAEGKAVIYVGTFSGSALLLRPSVDAHNRPRTQMQVMMMSARERPDSSPVSESTGGCQTAGLLCDRAEIVRFTAHHAQLQCKLRVWRAVGAAALQRVHSPARTTSWLVVSAALRLSACSRARRGTMDHDASGKSAAASGSAAAAARSTVVCSIMT
jgi:hypothetical protein